MTSGTHPIGLAGSPDTSGGLLFNVVVILAEVTLEPGLILLPTNGLGVSWLMAVTFGVTSCPTPTWIPEVPVTFPACKGDRPWANEVADGRDLVSRMPDLVPDELGLPVVRDPCGDLAAVPGPWGA